MKKYLLGLFAVVLAVGFSAFTAVKKTDTTYHFKNGSTWVEIDEEEVCIPGSLTVCQIDNPETPAVGDMVTVYLSANDTPGNELRRN
jgi:hypothetical protein